MLKDMFARQDLADARALACRDVKEGRRSRPGYFTGPEAKALKDAYREAYAKALARKAG
jgi:hypothetical protein